MIGHILTAVALATLTPDGLGPVKIGMTRAQVEQALGAALEGEPAQNQQTCIEMSPPGRERGLSFMFEKFRLARISVTAPSRATTSRGIRISVHASAVHRAYGQFLRMHPKFDHIPGAAEDLVYWPRGAKAGLRFIIGSDRRVTAILAGTDSIYLVEGCE